MKQKGRLIIISGFSGVGKGTVIRELMSRDPDFAFSVSGTTRRPREGEMDGREYFFFTREEFERKIAAGQFLEYAEYSGNYYGTPRDYVEAKLAEGTNIILDIEYQGAMQVKERMPEAVLIFLIPPSADVLVRRLLGRGTETPEQIRTRMAQAEVESGYADRYDALLVNDDLEQTLADIRLAMEDEAARAAFYEKNLPGIAAIRRELPAAVEKYVVSDPK